VLANFVVGPAYRQLIRAAWRNNHAQALRRGGSGSARPRRGRTLGLRVAAMATFAFHCGPSLGRAESWMRTIDDTHDDAVLGRGVRAL